MASQLLNPRRAGQLTAGLAVAFFTHVGCTHPARHQPVDDKKLPPIVEVRDIRVLLTTAEGPVRLRSPGGISWTDDQNRPMTRLEAGRWIEASADGGRIVLNGQPFNTASVRATVPPGAYFEFAKFKNGRWSPSGRYADGMRLAARRSSLQVINEVDVETYLPGVLTRELYPDFHIEAFRAQAVAARTYALHQMARRANQDYDVTAGQGSQVYGGIAGGTGASAAAEAVRSTRGIVCTWTAPEGERIFCTYYSSACGGASQDVAASKPVPSIPPLSGGVRCDYCRIARGEAYRWQSVRMSKADLRERLMNRYPDIANLGDYFRVQVYRRTPIGRPATIRLIGATGQTRDIVAEDFRLAVGSMTMRSTNCQITDEGDHVLFSEGKGFGHGIGMCQWGAQGQALAGKTASQILRFYYPESHLTRVY